MKIAAMEKKQNRGKFHDRQVILLWFFDLTQTLAFEKKQLGPTHTHTLTHMQLGLKRAICICCPQTPTHFPSIFHPSYLPNKTAIMPRFCSQIGGNIFEALRFGQWVAGVDWIGGLIGAGGGAPYPGRVGLGLCPVDLQRYTKRWIDDSSMRN